MGRFFISPSGALIEETSTRDYIGPGGATISETSDTGPVAPVAAIGWIEGSETFAAAVDVVISGAAAAISWTEGSETFAMAGTVTAPAATLAAAWTEGNETCALVGSVASLVPTINIIDIKNNSGYLRANEVFDAYIYHLTTGALIVKLAAQTSTAGADLALASASMTAATEYRVVLVDSSGEAGVGKATAA